MNCAIHPEVAGAAYCRTCGKPLCEECKRDVRGVIYCEECIAARLSGTAPAAPGAPNPALAAVLGCIPFGIGAVYNGQYLKGLAHMVIFVLLIAGADRAHGPLDTFFGLGIAFWVIYQIVDAYRTAKAKQLGLPLPDPFGLNRILGDETGAAGKSSGAAAAVAPYSQGAVPLGPSILIALGVLFLLRTLNIFPYSVGKLWPLILIALGVRLLLRNRGAR